MKIETYMKVSEEFDKKVICEPDISDDTFERTTKVHDWRNHVSSFVQSIWPELDAQERKLIAVLAQDAANDEEWD